MSKKAISMGIMLLSIIIILISANIYENYFREPETSIGKIKLKIAGDNNFKPYEYLNEKGEYEGFNIDIMKAIEKSMGIEIELIPMRWNDAIIALDNGEVDGVQGLSKTEDRKSKYRFTQYTIINSHSIFVAKDMGNINEFEDLEGLRITYRESDICEEQIKRLNSITSLPKDNYADGIKALLNDDADVFIGNRVAAIHYLNDINMSKQVKTIGVPFKETAYGPAMLPANKLTYRLLEEGLVRIKRDGAYDKIYRKWFGGQLSNTHLILMSYIRNISIGAGIIGTGILLLFAWNSKLHKEVAKRTFELKAINEDLKVHQDKIYRLAYYDSITGLPNKVLFAEKLRQTIQGIEDDGRIAVLQLDLDRFKYINDNLGHDIGDQVLKLIGMRLSRLVHSDGLIARGDGDKYLVLLKNINDMFEIDSFLNIVIDDFKNHIVYKGHELFLTTSIGVALYPDAGKDDITLLKNAETAMYEAKERGGNNYFKYSEQIARRGYDNLNILNQLRQAVFNEEFILYYQPKVSLIEHKIIGMESLIRWQNPDKGIVYPDEFIPLAEETGLIIPIGEWALREACRQNKEWIDKGYEPRKISVNISARQFQYYNFLDTVINILEETQLPPKYLGLEITETTAISDIMYTIQVLNELKGIGVFIILDDFGTGYSNLSYLSGMNIDELKIDKSFIWDLNSNEKNRAIYKTIILLAKQFNMLVTSEGIETEEQLNAVRELGSDIGQGYYFSKPIPPEELEKHNKF